MKEYFQRAKKWLYDQNILPLIITKKNMPGYMTVEEIAEAMKPVPYSEIADQLPIEFARTTRSILEEKTA